MAEKKKQTAADRKQPGGTSGGQRSKSTASQKKTTSKAKAKTASHTRGKRQSAPSAGAVLLDSLLMGLCGLLFLAFLLVPDRMGTVGGFMRDVLFGMAGRAAYLIPVTLLIGACFLGKDMEMHAIGLKCLFGVLVVTLTGVLFHVGCVDDPTLSGQTAFGYVAALYKMGAAGTGGGVLGGLLGWLLSFIGSFGTYLVTIPALFLVALFFVGKTPKSLYITIQYYVYRYLENRDARREETAATREAEEAALAARRQQVEEMRRAAALRREARQTAAVGGGVPAQKSRRNKTANIDENIYSEETVPGEVGYVAPSVPEVPSHAEEPTPPPRTGTPVPGSVYERPMHTTEGDTQNAPVPAEEGPDSEAYEAAMADSPMAEEAASDTGSASHLTPERHAAPSAVPTGELDLHAIFRDPEEGDGVAQRIASAVSADVTGEGQRADLTLSVTRGVPDGMDAPEDYDLPDTETVGGEYGTLPEDEYDDEDPEALLAALSAAYGGTVKEAPPAPEPPKYVYPPITLLKQDTSMQNEDISEELQRNGDKLVGILRSFNVKTKIVHISRGPTVTRYELQPEPGTRVRSVANLVDDIALGMAASGVRIEAPIPGKSAIGIEVPNETVSMVYIRSLLEGESYQGAKSRIITGLGMDVAGAPVLLDIAKMPHLLICGATGSGKSVCINALIISMLYKATPDEVKLILIDPKKVELNIYSGVPHLLVPVVSDPKKAAGSLHWAVTEMERRFELIESVGMRDIRGYNEITKNDPEKEYMPQIVIIIDELADLMMTAPDDVEESICRLAQKARAAGMHLIIGTQRPSVDVITGLIKANIPSRIAFRVSSQMDSRVILDVVGAEKLLGYGDMLYAPVGAPKPLRVQGAFVSEEEIDAVVTFLKRTAGHAEYADDVMASIEKEAELCGQKKRSRAETDEEGDLEGMTDDPMLGKAIELAIESGKISTSLIQRRLQLGYGRAAKLVDCMEQLGYVSPPEGQKPRTVLITKEQYYEMQLRDE